MAAVAAGCSNAVDPGDSGSDGGCACCSVVVAEGWGSQGRAYEDSIGEGVEDVDTTWASEKSFDDDRT